MIKKKLPKKRGQENRKYKGIEAWNVRRECGLEGDCVVLAEACIFWTQPYRIDSE